MGTWRRDMVGAIERQEESALGTIGGILATNGEAADGHILSIHGGRATPGSPLLFGHDAHSGTSNLGSWTGFSKEGDDSKLAAGKLRGKAGIELEGIGSQADWRADLAHMIAREHVRGLSIRWEEANDPVRRVNLPRDHFAFVDASKTNDRRRYGLFFDRWRMLEGSVVTLGADPEAIIGRVRDTVGDVRRFWRVALADMMQLTDEKDLPEDLRDPVARFRGAIMELKGLGVEDFGALLRACQDIPPEDLVAVPYSDGKRILIPQEAHAQLMGSANERLRVAFDLTVEATQYEDPDPDAGDDVRSEKRSEPEPEVPERAEGNGEAEAMSEPQTIQEVISQAWASGPSVRDQARDSLLEMLTKG